MRLSRLISCLGYAASEGASWSTPRRIDRVAIGALGVDGFAIEVAGMNYGFAIDGILGMNLLRRMNAVLDLGRLEIDFHA